MEEKTSLDPYYVISNFNFLVISVLGGYTLIETYPYFPKIVGLLFSAFCMWYLSKLINYYKE